MGHTWCVFPKPCGFCLLALKRQLSHVVLECKIYCFLKETIEINSYVFIPFCGVSLSRFTSWNLLESPPSLRTNEQ